MAFVENTFIVFTIHCGMERTKFEIQTKENVFLLSLVNLPGLKIFSRRMLTNFIIKYTKWYYDAAERIILDRRNQPVSF